MKFENIKEGDTVYIQRTVLLDVYEKRSFWVPVIVERTTKTQFTSGGNRYKKDSGRMIGCNSFCFRAEPAKDGVVYDQSSEMEELESKLRLVSIIGDSASGLNAVRHDNANLKEVFDLVSRAAALLKEGKQ